ncbi:MAG TPA: class E sortase, partial [Bacillota bacterium]
LGALDPIFNRADDDPTLAAPDGAASLPTRDTIAGVSRIIIEKAGVDAMVVDGTTVGHLRQGPGFYPEGSLPDLGGNVAIAGHRTTYGAWFRHLDRLEPGDLIRLIYKGVIHNYRVEWVRQIAANDWSVIAPTEEHVLTLTTCDPPGYSTYRLAVRARWIGTSRLPTGGVR